MTDALLLCEIASVRDVVSRVGVGPRGQGAPRVLANLSESYVYATGTYLVGTARTVRPFSATEGRARDRGGLPELCSPTLPPVTPAFARRFNFCLFAYLVALA